jgi:hypothetical protein
MAWLKYITLLPLIYTLVKESVALAEDVAADGDIDGPEKKAAVLAAVKSGLTSLGYGAIAGVLEPILSAVIDITVGIFNALKWKKAGPMAEGISTDSVVAEG